jgi:nicotinamidase/pyrazinamidase
MERVLSEAFLVIDVQNDFCPGGALAVLEGDKIVQPINEAMDKFDLVVLTQDWHPKNINPSHLLMRTKGPLTQLKCFMEIKFYGRIIVFKDHWAQIFTQI